MTVPVKWGGGGVSRRVPRRDSPDNFSCRPPISISRCQEQSPGNFFQFKVHELRAPYCKYGHSPPTFATEKWDSWSEAMEYKKRKRISLLTLENVLHSWPPAVSSWPDQCIDRPPPSNRSLDHQQQPLHTLPYIILLPCPRRWGWLHSRGTRFESLLDILTEMSR
jgi:hypothetical protein